MHYLTTHDLVWVNRLVTGKIQPYNYVTLEAVMAGQYRYGASQNVPEQAAVLLDRLLFKAPFAEGNRRTALIALLAFLDANGYQVRVDDVEAARLLLTVVLGQQTSAEAVAALAAPAGEAHTDGVTLRKRIAHEFNAHTEAVRALTPGD